MSDYVLEGEKWGGSTFGTAGGNVTWAIDSSVSAALVNQIQAAFADWSTYANIIFQQVSSTSSAQIDLSESYIDGQDNVLGDTSYYYSGTSFTSAQITFDSSEGWRTSGNNVVSSDGLNFFVVALHEIGHAIGLDHYNASSAVMNASIDRSVTDLRQSDIDGVQAIYGAAQVDHAPVVQTQTVSLARSTTLAASSLFTASDPDNDAISAYEFWDSTRDAASGHFVVNGVAQSAGTVIHISAAQLAQTTFVTGTLADQLQVRAFDGHLWSAGDTDAWAPFNVTVTEHAPVVTTTSQTLYHNTTVLASSLFSVSDADGDAMTAYEFWDSTRDGSSGHFIVNGVAQAAGTVIHITAAQLASTSFQAGTVGDSLQVRAIDGAQWSAGDTANWSPFTVIVPVDHAPVVATSDQFVAKSASIAASSLITVSDADSDVITRYEFWDSTRDPNSGHFVINGVAQAAGTVIDITAAQLSQTTFQTGTVGDSLQVRAFDGGLWSAADNAAWNPFTLSVNHAPVVITSDHTVASGASVAVSSLFSVTDADHDAITAYELWDSTRDPRSGHFVVDGVAQAAGTVIHITADQLAHTSFQAGTVGDDLQIRTFDGADWSAADTAPWAPFHLATDGHLLA